MHLQARALGFSILFGVTATSSCITPERVTDAGSGSTDGNGSSGDISTGAVVSEEDGSLESTESSELDSTDTTTETTGNVRPACDGEAGRPGAVLWSQTIPPGNTGYDVASGPGTGIWIAGVMEDLGTHAWIVGLDGAGVVQWSDNLSSRANFAGATRIATISFEREMGAGIVVGGFAIDEIVPAKPRMNVERSWVRRYDSDGEIMWQADFSSDRNLDPEEVMGLVVQEDSSILVLSAAHYAGTILRRLSPAGDLLSSTFVWPGEGGRAAARTAVRMAQLPGGDIVLAGQVGQRWMARLTSQGAVVWNNEWEDPQTISTARAMDVAVDPEGGIVIVGSVPVPSDSGSGFKGAGWLARVDFSGEILWEETWEHRGASIAGSGVAIAPDGTITTAATVQTPAGSSQGELQAFTPDGALLWSTMIDGTVVLGVETTEACEVIVTGRQASELFVAELAL